MPRRATICVCLLLLAVPVLSQTSIGYIDDQDLESLLAYRLPDWGWRTWDISGEFQGAGATSTSAGEFSAGQDVLEHSANAFTRIRRYREGEEEILELGGMLRGSWDRERRATDDDIDRERTLSGMYQLNGTWIRYVGRGDWFVDISGRAVGTYQERSTEFRSGEISGDRNTFDRGHSHNVNLGIGWGRMRDVTPLIRAERIAARLVALGRPRPTPPQILAMAEGLARESGYRIVFDRPERRLWDDVLAPVLGAEPLSVAEVFYIADMLREDLGVRRQGIRVEAGPTWYQSGLGGGSTYTPGLFAELAMSRNLSLPLQISAELGWRWLHWNRGDAQDSDERDLQAYANLGLLWNVADRMRLDAVIAGEHAVLEPDAWSGESTSSSVSLDLDLRIYLEDRLALRPFVRARWSEAETDIANPQEFYRMSQSWSYGIAIDYSLDTLLW